MRCRQTNPRNRRAPGILVIDGLVDCFAVWSPWGAMHEKKTAYLCFTLNSKRQAAGKQVPSNLSVFLPDVQSEGTRGVLVGSWTRFAQEG